MVVEREWKATMRSKWLAAAWRGRGRVWRALRAAVTSSRRASLWRAAPDDRRLMLRDRVSRTLDTLLLSSWPAISLLQAEEAAR